jgi:two-component system response regulator FixJ
MGRILVVDDHDSLRKGLVRALVNAGHDVEEAPNGTVAIERLQDSQFDVVLTDLRMGGADGMDVLRTTRSIQPNSAVILMTAFGSIHTAVEAMKIGAVDFLEKPFDDDQLLAAVRAALSYDADIGKRKAELADIHDKLAALSNRERQVLEGLVVGNANQTIAFDLGISPRTVEIYRANLMTKMSANSLSDLVRMAIVTGVLNNSDKSGR